MFALYLQSLISFSVLSSLHANSCVFCHSGEKTGLGLSVIAKGILCLFVLCLLCFCNELCWQCIVYSTKWLSDFDLSLVQIFFSFDFWLMVLEEVDSGSLLGSVDGKEWPREIGRKGCYREGTGGTCKCNRWWVLFTYIIRVLLFML